MEVGAVLDSFGQRVSLERRLGDATLEPIVERYFGLTVVLLEAAQAHVAVFCASQIGRWLVPVGVL